MNTIDMNQVAGLQAVDAEGNVIGTLSVDDLTNLVANNLVKSTQNQIAAQSVSTLSDATTLAASDEYENTLPVDDNPKSVRTLDAAGNPKQTGINALAQVVGGLVVQGMLDNSNIDNAVTHGMYLVGNNISGANNDYGLLIVFNGEENYASQVLFGYSGLHYRLKTRGDDFTGIVWKNID